MQVWLNGVKRDEMKGANASALEAMIQRYCVPSNPVATEDRIFFVGQVIASLSCPPSQLHNPI